MRNFTLVATFICLWLSRFFDQDIQAMIAYFIILTVGVLHGANDISILKVTSGNKNYGFNYTKVLAMYVAVVLIVLLVFLWKPNLALPIFVLLSAYHFGEQHLRPYLKKQTIRERLYYLSYGNLILFMIFSIKYNKVTEVVYELTAISLTKNQLLIGLGISAVIFLAVSIDGLLKKELKLNIYKELLYLGILFIVFDSASLVWGFAIYFVFWHSIPSIADQIQFLYNGLNPNTAYNYFKSSWLYWMASLVGLLVLFLFFRHDSSFLITILISFLSAITVPHVIVMTGLENNNVMNADLID